MTFYRMVVFTDGAIVFYWNCIRYNILLNVTVKKKYDD